MARLPTQAPRLSTLPSRIKPQPKVKDQHYYTPEHRAWSRAVIARAGHACQCKGCKACSPRGCGRTNTRLFADHIAELQDGGASLDLANGQALCGACHTCKTAAARAARQRGGRV